MFQLYERITAGLVVVSSQGADGFPGPVGVPGEKGKKVTENMIPQLKRVIKTHKSTNISVCMCTHVSIMCFSGSNGSCRGRRSEGTQCECICPH